MPLLNAPLHIARSNVHFRPDAALAKPTYRQVRDAAAALTMATRRSHRANVAALMWDYLRLNWAGLPCAVNELVLGPFAGRPACIVYRLGRACAAPRRRAAPQLVADGGVPVHHPCDAAPSNWSCGYREGR